MMRRRRRQCVRPRHTGHGDRIVESFCGLEQRGESRAVCLFFGIESDRLPPGSRQWRRRGLPSPGVPHQSLMRPGMVRPGLDHRTQDCDDTVLIAPVFQHRNKIRHGARMAGFDPESVAVGSDGPILIAPDREQVPENVILTGVAGPAPIVSRAAAMAWSSVFSPSSRCCRPKRIVPRHPMFRASAGRNLTSARERWRSRPRLVPSDRASGPGYGLLPGGRAGAAV